MFAAALLALVFAFGLTLLAVGGGILLVYSMEGVPESAAIPMLVGYALGVLAANVLGVYRVSRTILVRSGASVDRVRAGARAITAVLGAAPVALVLLWYLLLRLEG